MYACGIPVGLIVDAKGPLPGLLLGAASLGIGYFPIYRGLSLPGLFTTNERSLTDKFISVRGWAWINGRAPPPILLLHFWTWWLLRVFGCHKSRYGNP